MENAVQRSTNEVVKEFDVPRPVVNIGRHPENDIVLPGPDVFPFHAILIAQEQSFQLVALESPTSICIDGVPLQASPASFGSHQRLMIGMYSLIFTSAAGSQGVHVKILDSGPGPVDPVQQAEAYRGDLPILVNIVEQLAEVDVEQTAFYDLEITNNGQFVAGFSVSVSGVPVSWVSITPRHVNLYEEQCATVRVSITPPREPSSRAGKHALLATVQSSNYAGYPAVAPLELAIKPYYKFMPDNLEPQHQRIFWRGKSASTNLAIRNQGNSAADFSITSFDHENGCTFEYLLEDGLYVARQAVISLPADSTKTLPIRITPLKHPLVSIRSRKYSYMTTVQLVQQPLLPQTLTGSVSTVPLIGWWAITLIAILLLLGLFYLAQPRIFNFGVAGGQDIIEKGETADLVWQVSPLVTRLRIENLEESLEPGKSSVSVSPAETTTYKLLAGNWLSGLLGRDQSRSVTVQVLPEPAPQEEEDESVGLYLIPGTGGKEVYSVGEQETFFIGFYDPEKSNLSATPPNYFESDTDQTGQVVVNAGSGSAICTITLPETSCTLTLDTPGDVEVTARYYADQDDSVIGASAMIHVIGSPAVLVPEFYLLAPSDNPQGDPIDITTAPLSHDTGLFVRVEIIPQSNGLPSSNVGTVSMYLCEPEPVESAEPVARQACPSYESKEVPSPGSNDTLEVDFELPGFPAGTHVLSFSYEADGIDPLFSEEFNVHVQEETSAEETPDGKEEVVLDWLVCDPRVVCTTLSSFAPWPRSGLPLDQHILTMEGLDIVLGLELSSPEVVGESLYIDLSSESRAYCALLNPYYGDERWQEITSEQKASYELPIEDSRGVGFNLRCDYIPQGSIITLTAYFSDGSSFEIVEDSVKEITIY